MYNCASQFTFVSIAPQYKPHSFYFVNASKKCVLLVVSSFQCLTYDVFACLITSAKGGRFLCAHCKSEFNVIPHCDITTKLETKCCLETCRWRYLESSKERYLRIHRFWIIDEE